MTLKSILNSRKPQVPTFQARNVLGTIVASLDTCTHLGPKVRDADELLQHVLGEDVGVPRLLDVIR